jgi:hypothetical protein
LLEENSSLLEKVDSEEKTKAELVGVAKENKG